MDAFVFDQKFARYMAHVDTAAIARGTDLYEKGQARVSRIDAKKIEGSVVDGKSGVFGVTLVESADGGWSGSCSCDEFFNCRHSYAVARAARDQVMGRTRSTQGGESANAKERRPDPFEERAGGGLDPEQARFSGDIQRLWKVAAASGFLLYPKDLHPFARNRRQVGQSPAEPLRDLRRWLSETKPESAVEMADLLKGYFEYKGYEAEPTFGKLARGRAVTEAGAALGGKGGAASWDRPALRVSLKFRLEATSDRDWFQVSAVPDLGESGLAPDQVRRLVAANGELVQIEGKGWLRVDPAVDPEQLALVRSLGLDAQRGNSQRVHVTQLEELLPFESILAVDDLEAILERARTLRQFEPVEEPKALRGVLRPYQKEGFQFLCRLTQLGFGGMLADDMGLGKTLQTLAWLLWQVERKPRAEPFRILVVCPKSVTDNWLQEPGKFKTGLSAVSFRSNLIGSPKLAEANLVVANYAQLRINAAYFHAQEWDVAVLDEAQYIKSPESQTTKVAYKLNAKQRLILTGTPVENSLMDLWSLMRFAMPRLLGPQATFRLNYEASRDEQALAGLKKRIRPFILRRLKSEVAKDLPARIEEEIHCELEGAQRSLYEQEMEAARAALRGLYSEAAFKRARFNVLQALLRIRQICCDPQLLDAEWTSDEPSAKVQALLDIVLPLVEEGHKVLIFSQFVRMLEIIEKALGHRDVPCLSLTGKTRNRKQLIDRFQSSGAEQVFLLSLKAAGSGLNLTAASYVVLFDPWWNPAVEAQAIDRTHRIGQTNPVIAYRILAKNTVEEKIRRIQSEKADLARSIVGEETLGAALGLEELQKLLE